MRRASPACISDFDAGERADELALRAQKLRRKGEWRRAAFALREATALDESNAPRFMILAHLLARVGLRDDAARAMKQALYLRERRGERARANVIRRLLLNLAAT